MTIHELAAQFGVSTHTIRYYKKTGIIPPAIGNGRSAHYDNRHVEAIRDYRAILHNNASARGVVAFCREQGITLSTYIKQREASIREFGIGIA